MPFAVIQTGGKQHRVEPGQTIDVEKLAGEAGDTIELTEVLLVSTDDGLQQGKPLISGAKVVARRYCRFKASGSKHNDATSSNGAITTASTDQFPRRSFTAFARYMKLLLRRTGFTRVRGWHPASIETSPRLLPMTTRCSDDIIMLTRFTRRGHSWPTTTAHRKSSMRTK